ncbi:MAG: hypothetical protein NVSMB19_08940 [Vulcanimicrobiaceae bacterium]
MSPRAFALAAAALSIALVLAQDVAPAWAGFHTWQYAAALALGAIALGGYMSGARRGEDGTVGRRLIWSLTGALVVVAAGIASGLLGPDTETVMRAPGTVAPLPDVGAAAFFPVADAAAIVRGDTRIALRRRTAGPLDIGPGERRYVGATALELAPQVAAYVEARSLRGERLTITQPTNPAFLSPVLLFAQQVPIAGKLLPADTFAVPAVHRQIKAFYFAKGAGGASVAAHGGPGKTAAVLFAVDDENGRLEPGGIGFASSGSVVALGGLRLRPTVGTYPALIVSAVPYPLALWVGGALFVGGLAYALLPRRSPVAGGVSADLASVIE